MFHLHYSSEGYPSEDNGAGSRAENIRESIVIIIGKSAFGILKLPKTSLRGYINEGPISVVLIKNQVGFKVPEQKVDMPIIVIIAPGHASSSPPGIGNSCCLSNIRELPGS